MATLFMHIRWLLFISIALWLAGCTSPTFDRQHSDNPSPEHLSAAAADASSGINYTLYLRGAFNGWGSDNAFTAIGNARYQAIILVAPGNHEFKLASKDWRQQWTTTPHEATPIALAKGYTLVNGGAGNFLFVEHTSTYRFTVDFSNSTQPQFTVIKIAAKSISTPNPHRSHTLSRSFNFTTHDSKSETVKISARRIGNTELRRYGHSTTQALRDPVPQARSYSEHDGYPRVRSGNIEFDALFALAIDEMRLNSVSEIRDGNYNNGDAIACDCFETGERWHYVWTRDLAYAADLSLAMLDPERTANSLEFKLSSFRDGTEKPSAVPGLEHGLQIVQDSGTGGSWPASTDRVSWAFGAEKAIQYLHGERRKEFIKYAYSALTNTIKIDRAAAFDGNDGLYIGEQSFLDWREQSYASWVVYDIASLGTSKSLSTNVAHFQALRLASRLANELGDNVDSIRFGDWALDLRAAINKKFWQEDKGMYSSITGPHFNDIALNKYDWLGISLAIITGVADERKAQLSVANYPHGPMGAPVIFPQQAAAPIYHNRAIWPFVSAYGLKASIRAGNSAVAEEAYRTLMRAAALNMSNMENIEWLSGQPILLDKKHPGLSGPVINSQRQLWSVGGYLGMVIEGIFGVHTDKHGLQIKPAIPSDLRRVELADTKTLELHDLIIRGKIINIQIQLPKSTDYDGFLRVQRYSLNGAAAESHIDWEDLSDENTIVVKLSGFHRDNRKITRVTGNPYSNDDPALFAPHDPSIPQLGNTGIHRLKDTDAVDLFKNGLLFITGNSAEVSSAINANTNDNDCFTIVATDKTSGNSSHHSAPLCTGSIQRIQITDSRVRTQHKTYPEDPTFTNTLISDFGGTNETLEVRDILISEAGEYAIQFEYHNDQNLINLGITNAVKWLEVLDNEGNPVARGVIQMPHSQSIDGVKSWVKSSPLRMKLPIGSYRLTLSDFMNMSYLDTNSTFTGSGGTLGKKNTATLNAVIIQRLPN